MKSVPCATQGSDYDTLSSHFTQILLIEGPSMGRFSNSNILILSSAEASACILQTSYTVKGHTPPADPIAVSLWFRKGLRKTL